MKLFSLFNRNRSLVGSLRVLLLSFSHEYFWIMQRNLGEYFYNFFALETVDGYY